MLDEYFSTRSSGSFLHIADSPMTGLRYNCLSAPPIICDHHLHSAIRYCWVVERRRNRCCLRVLHRIGQRLTRNPHRLALLERWNQEGGTHHVKCTRSLP